VPSTSPFPVSTPLPGIVLVDDSGVIHLATASAAPWLGAEPSALRGQAFISRFEFEVLADDKDTARAQWELVLAGALGVGGEILTPRTPPEGPRVRVRAEAAGGPGDGYCLNLSPIETVSPHATDESETPALTLWRDHAQVGFFDLHFAANSIHFSPGWKRQLGYQDEELTNTHDTWQRLIHPEDSAAAPDKVGRKPSVASRAFDVEYRLQHRRGHWVWLQGVGVQCFAADGSLARAVGVQLDITARKELEEEALLNDERWLAVTTSAGLAAFDVDFVAGTVWLSPAWRDLTDTEPTTPEELAMAFPAAAEMGLSQLLGNAADAPLATTLHTRDASPAPVTLHVEGRRTRQGDLQRAIGYALPQVGAGAAAADSASLSVLDALQEGVILADTEGRITYLNQVAERLTGQTRAEARNQPLGEVLRLVTATEGRPVPDAIDLAISAGEGPQLTTDHALATAAGRPPRPIVWTARHLAGGGGAPPGIVVIFRDPQEMSLTPEELLRTNCLDSLGVLAGAIAHDFNNILATVLGGISQAKDNRDYGNLGDAEQACLAAKALTRQLLTFTKGAPDASRLVVRPSELMRDAARVAAAGSPVKVELTLDEETQPIEVNHGQMLQVFQNLILNAIQAMPNPSAGCIRLTCAAHHLAEGNLPPLPAGDYVRFEVADNGTGIPPEMLTKVFAPFFSTKKPAPASALPPCSPSCASMAANWESNPR